MALLLANTIAMFSVIVNTLLTEVVNSDSLREPREGPEPVWNSLGPVGGNSSLLDLSHQNYRGAKYLSPFTVVEFANTDCTSAANGLTGTCYTFWDCMSGASGDNAITLSGSCMFGFGTCCTSVLGCGATSSNNNTWLRSPGYPSSFNYATDCKQKITIEEDICQLRLEIEDLTLDYPDSTGSCSTDYLTVNHDIKFDKLCGKTTSNHFYLDVDYSSNSDVEFNFVTNGATSFDRSWSIRVQKICCDSDEEAPRGCGQYYTGTTGTIKSLNYEAPASDDYIISKLNYGICVRMELGYCQNTYTENKNDGWSPICPDIFEKPGRYDSLELTKSNVKCAPSGTKINQPVSQTYSYLTPHIFKLDTTRGTSNTHQNSNANNNGGVYYMTYSQTSC